METGTTEPRLSTYLHGPGLPERYAPGGEFRADGPVQLQLQNVLWST